MLKFIKNTNQNKGNSILKFILLSLGIVLLIWYLAPLVSNIFNAGNIVGIICSVSLILVGCFYGKMPNVLKNMFFALIALALVVIIPLSFNMARYANYKTQNGVKTVIVLGCKVNGTNPSKYLYDRCAKAYEYLNENKDAVAILSGGQGPDEGISEALCMKNVLTEMGVDENRLILEDKSTSTKENIEFSKVIIQNENLSQDVLVVTNEFHEYRAKLLCDKYELNFHSKCSYSSFYTFLTFYTRELMGLFKQIVL